jgi:hypothetical protein
MHSGRMVPICAWVGGPDPRCCDIVKTLPRMVGPSYQRRNAWKPAQHRDDAPLTVPSRRPGPAELQEFQFPRAWTLERSGRKTIEQKSVTRVVPCGTCCELLHLQPAMNYDGYADAMVGRWHRRRREVVATPRCDDDISSIPLLL